MNPPIPTNYIIGNVSRDGDSFFSSVAQVLRQVRGGKFTEKMLRQECKEYAQNCGILHKTIGDLDADEYVKRIQYGADECESPIRGRPEIEGQIICKHMMVRMYIMQKQVSDHGHDRPLWSSRMVDSTGYRLVEHIDYELDETVYIIQEGNLIFKPILKNIPKAPFENVERLCADLEGSQIAEVNGRQTGTFNKRKGAAGASGHFYEIKLLTLFYLSLQETDRFYLASNLENAGAFDDAAFCFEITDKKGIKQSKTIFLQAKHRDNKEAGSITIDNLLSPRGAFSLKKYFDSFREIKGNFKPTTDPIFNGKFEDCSFVIFTNYELFATKTNKKRWVNKAADGIVISEGKQSKCLNVDEDINQDITTNLSCSPVQLLAKEIYDYTLGNKMRHYMNLENELFKEYHIFLANEVFSVNSKPGKSKFRDDVRKVGRFGEELFRIANCSEEDFTKRLKQAKVKLGPNFGNGELKLEGQNFDNLVAELANVIGRSESNVVIIENPSDDVKKLANNVLVKGDLLDNSCELVKFSEMGLTGQAKEFMTRLEAKLVETSSTNEFGLAEIKLEIKGFPRFSLPPLDTDITEDEVKQFLRKLYFVFDQDKEDALDGVIKAKIKTAYGANDEECNAIFESVRTQVEKWWKSDNYFLTKGTKFVENARASISHFQLNALDKLNKRGIEITGVQFNETAQKQMQEMIDQKQVLNIVADKGTTMLSSVKMCQTLRERFGEASYIFIDINHLLNIQDLVLNVFQSKETHKYLLIESNSIFLTRGKWTDEDIEKLRVALMQITKKNRDKTIILITENDDMLAKTFDYSLGNFTKKCDNIYTNFNDLKYESQQRLLEKEVTLQGKTIKLKELIDIGLEGANKTITSKILQDLVSNDNLTISKEPQRLSDLEAAYAKLYEEMPREKLLKELLSCDKDIMFVVSGINQSKSGDLSGELVNQLGITNPNVESNLRERIAVSCEANDDKSIIIIPNDNKAHNNRHFKEICTKNKCKTVYWVEFTQENVHLQQVYDPKFYIMRKFKYWENVVLKLDLILQKNPKAMFIFSSADDRKKVERLVADIQKTYLRNFAANCRNETIVFAKSEQDAEHHFENIKDVNINVHWLRIDRSSKRRFTWYRSHNATTGDTQSENLEFQTDLLVQKNSSHVFIFKDINEKPRLINMIKASCVAKRQQFTDNCRRRIIRFYGERRNESHGKNVVHWLKIGGDELLWEKSHGSLTHLRRFIDAQRNEQRFYTEEKFRKEVKDEVVIIADEPGMGKTTALTSVSQQMLDEYWVIRINFKDCEQAIEILPDAELVKITMENVYNFVSNVESTGLEDELAKHIFTRKLEQKGYQHWPILILFDGFDEISEEHQRKIIPLLRYITRKTSAKLWVATRPHMKEVLENSLSVFATEFQALNLEDQAEFLNRFWRIRLGPLLKLENMAQSIRKYSSWLLEKSAGIIGKNILCIMGIPLQLLLFAEGLKRDVINYLNTNLPPDIETLNVLQVYQRFINDKYAIYVTEKIGLGKVAPSVISILVKGFHKHHETSAMHLLFPENESLIYPTRIDTEQSKDLTSVGIIQSIGRERKPYFIHRTFAEYFAAKFLESYLDKKETNPKKYGWATRFLMKHIFEERNNVIREFLDHMLSEDSPIHIAALANNLRDVIELTKDITRPKTVDNLDRTALHLAAIGGHLNIVKVLLDSGYDAVTSDALGKTPLHYATMNNHKEVVEHLLNYTADIDIGDNVFATPVHVDMEVGTSLFKNEEHLKSALVRFVNQQDIDGKPAFYYGTEINDWGIACTLISYGANISFGSESNQRNFTSYVIDKTASDLHTYFTQNTEYTGILGLLLINYIANVCIYNIYYAWDRILGAFVTLGHTKLIHVIVENMRSTECFKILETSAMNITYPANLSDMDNLKVAKYFFGKCNHDSLIKTLGNCAAENGNLETLKYILEQEQEKNCMSYVSEAIKRGQLNIVMYLVENYPGIITNDKINTALYVAVEYNRLGIVKYLVGKGADINECNEKGKTLMQYASEYNAIIVMPYLAKNCVVTMVSEELGHKVKNYVQKCFIFHQNELMQNDVMDNLTYISEIYPNVAGLTDYTKVADIIMYQVQNDVNCHNEHGTTLLHIAAKFCSKSFARYLIKHGANVNFKDNNGRTPLHKAVQAYCEKRNNGETIVYLLEHGTAYDEKDENDKTILDYISQATTSSDYICKLLQTIDRTFKSFDKMYELVENYYICDFNIITTCRARNSDGNTVYHLAALSNAGKLHRLFEKYEFITHAGRNIQCKSGNREGNTPLHLAAGSGHVQDVAMLIKHGCPYNSRNKENNTPKDLAQNNSHKNVVEFIESIENAFTAIKGGDTFNIKPRICEKFIDEDGKTMLHWAAANGNVGITELLIKNRVDINQKDNSGWTPLHYAAKNDEVEIVKLLLNECAKFNLKNSDGKSPNEVATGRSLHLLETVNKIYNTIQFDSPEIANECLRSMQMSNHEGFDTAISSTDNFGNVLFDYAVEANDLDLVLLLLQNKIHYPNFMEPYVTKDHNYDKEIRYLLCFIHQLFKWSSPLIYSHKTIENCPTKLQFIKECRDKQENTILHYAAEHPVNYCRLKFLIKHGADINAVNKEGCTVLDVAIEKMNLDLVKFLLKNNVDVNKLAPGNKHRLLQRPLEEDRQDIADIFTSCENALNVTNIHSFHERSDGEFVGTKTVL